MWQQVQSWPTPEMFIHRRGGSNVETVSPFLSLESMIALPALPRAVSEDSPGLVALSLVSVRTNGPFPTIQSDNAAGNLALQSLINVPPMSRSQSDIANGSLSLSALVNVTAQTKTVSDTATGNLSLQSMIV